MFLMLAMLVVIAAMARVSSRLDDHGLRRAWLGTLLMTGIGGAILFVAEVTGNLGLFYLSALVLGIGVPSSVLLTAAVYMRRHAAA
jgi:Na+/melibiose symporter-like transporter